MATRKPKNIPIPVDLPGAVIYTPPQEDLLNTCSSCAAFVDRRNIGIGECRMNPPHAESGWPKLRSVEFCLQFKPK